MSFWNFFFLLLIYVPLMLMWAAALLDIFRRDDMGGVAKAIWVVLVIVIPFFGTLIYLILRHPGATPGERAAMDEAGKTFGAQHSDTTAQQLAILADLEERGKISAEEFASEKARVLGTSAPTASPA